MIKKLTIILLAIWTIPGWSIVDLELNQGINSALPIAIKSQPSNALEDTQKLTEVIKNDLLGSGQFKLIDSSNADPSLYQWKQLGADSVLATTVNVSGNQYVVQFALTEAVGQNRLLIAKKYTINRQDLRSLAHHISDEVYQKLTGYRGIFSTKIAYIIVQRQAGQSRYFLEVADVDGYNPQPLLTSSEPIMSPAWSPNGREIAYVSFEKKKAQVYTVNVETGQRKLVTSFNGINSAPAWSANGRELAVVLSKSGSPKIYRVNLNNGMMQQLTFGNAIDTEPRYSADGKYLLFTSGRGGSPQVYRLDLNNKEITRLTYDGNYNARASYTPDQKNIVLMHRENSQFNIAVQSDTGQLYALTSAALDESPSVAPNGRMILYATRNKDQGILAIVSIDGRIQLQLPNRTHGDVQEPAWSPFLG